MDAKQIPHVHLILSASRKTGCFARKSLRRPLQASFNDWPLSFSPIFDWRGDQCLGTSVEKGFLVGGEEVSNPSDILSGQEWSVDGWVSCQLRQRIISNQLFQISTATHDVIATSLRRQLFICLLDRRRNAGLSGVPIGGTWNIQPIMPHTHFV
jgi:hypothetical protein